MKLRTNNAMRNSLFTWITVVAVWLWLPYSIAKTTAETTTAKKPTLDQGTVQMLSNILESLDAFRNDRLKDLEKIRLAAPPTNGSTVFRADADVYKNPQNNSISEHIKALKEGIMGHNPVKKTFGYKVTVYTSPIGEDGKDGKPVLVTQYVGGDMAPDTPEAPDRRKGDIEDLQESANHPAKQLVHSSASAHLPVAVSLSDAGGGEGHEASSVDGATDHNRKTEHSASSEKGHQQGHSLHSKVAKGHDHERHSNKHDEHHKETEKESHRHDTQAHDKGGATQQGIRERTEIEYYEREHFLDTEYDKAKKGHDKTSGLKEHESHNDHDSYEDKKLHAKENSDHHKTHTGGSVATGSDTETAAIIDDHVRSPHYSPPYGVHYKKQPQVVHDGHHLKEDSHALKEDAESSRLHHSEESKGHREHNSERNLHKEENDKGYLDKDKGRRKEGYRERGYKITAEREYFLNDAHHDKGSSTHTSGSKLKDQEGTAHGSKEGERDRGFTKEEKIEEAHDAAYDAKNRHYYDGEQHKEDFSSGKTSSSSSGQKTQKEELVPLAPPAVNYVDAHPHPLPIFPLPIAYSPSNDGAKAVVAYPPDNLNPGKIIANDYQPPITNSRQTRNGRPSVSDLRKQEPIGGYDDDYDQPEKNGYVGHASYKKRNPSPLIASIRDSVRKDVHAKPPSYSKSDSTSSEENSVRFPAEESEKHKYSEERDSEEESEEVVFPQDDKQYKGDNRDRDNEDSYQLTPKPPTLIDLRKDHRHAAEKDRSYPEVPNQTRYHQNTNVLHKPYPQLQNTRDAQRYYEQIQPDVREVQHPDKLLRTVDVNAYSNIQSGKVPTNGHLSHDVLRYSQPQINQPYADVQRRNRNNNQVLYPDIQSFYNLGNQGPFGQRQLRVEKQPQNSLNVQQDQHTSRINQLLQTTQQQPVGRINQLIHNTQQQNPRPLTSVEQLPRAMSPLEQLQQLQARVTAQQQNNQRGLTLTQQHQNTQRGVTPLEQLQQQTKPPFSPVVLLSRGPPSQTQNHAVDVWYTRQQS